MMKIRLSSTHTLVLLVICLLNLKLGLSLQASFGLEALKVPEQADTPNPGDTVTSVTNSDFNRSENHSKLTDVNQDTHNPEDELVLIPVESGSIFDMQGTPHEANSSGTKNSVEDGDFLEVSLHDLETKLSFGDNVTKATMNEKLDLNTSNDSREEQGTKNEVISDQTNRLIESEEFKLPIDLKLEFSLEDYSYLGDGSDESYDLSTSYETVAEENFLGDIYEKTLLESYEWDTYSPPELTENLETGFFDGQPIRRFDGKVLRSPDEDSSNYTNVNTNDSIKDLNRSSGELNEYPDETITIFELFSSSLRYVLSPSYSFFLSSNSQQSDNQSFIPYSPPDESYVLGVPDVSLHSTGSDSSAIDLIEESQSNLSDSNDSQELHSSLADKILDLSIEYSKDTQTPAASNNHATETLVAKEVGEGTILVSSTTEYSTTLILNTTEISRSSEVVASNSDDLVSIPNALGFSYKLASVSTIVTSANFTILSTVKESSLSFMMPTTIKQGGTLKTASSGIESSESSTTASTTAEFYDITVISTTTTFV